jgi:hypothetical protein
MIEKAKQVPDKIVNIVLYFRVLDSQADDFPRLGVNTFYKLANLSLEAGGDLRLTTKFTKGEQCGRLYASRSGGVRIGIKEVPCPVCPTEH